MELSESIKDFYIVIEDDPRISPVHISLYMALMELWIRREYASPLLVFSHEVMPLAKISGIATYYRTIKQLHDFGYVRYAASFNRFEGSSVYLQRINVIQKKC